MVKYIYVHIREHRDIHTMVKYIYVYIREHQGIHTTVRYIYVYIREHRGTHAAVTRPGKCPFGRCLQAPVLVAFLKMPSSLPTFRNEKVETQLSLNSVI